MVGLEIRPEKADRARRNVATIDLLYLDADGAPGKGKSIYVDLLGVALHSLRPGSLVLAHNSVNSADELADYLGFVRDTAHFRDSVNVVIDDQGLEVSVR